MGYGEGGSEASPLAASTGGTRMMAKKQYYHDYLKLDQLLSSQQPLSAREEKPEGEHDEMLFIVIHQTYELWFKQVLHEIRAVVRMFENPMLSERESSRALHHMNRVCSILRHLVNQWDVLETMTPTDFMTFRDYLYPASGFQSVQFRELENLLGLDPSRRIKYQNASYEAVLTPEHQARVLETEKQTTLLRALERWLERTPFVQLASWDFLASYRQAAEDMYDEDAALVGAHFDPQSDAAHTEQAKIAENKRDFLALFDESEHERLVGQGLKTLSFKATQAALLITLYADQPQLSVPNQLLARVVDVDALLSQWRHRHALLVHRMLGSKLGTGGSSGYAYLRSMVEPSRVFRDIANLSTYIIRPSAIPPLPEDVRYQLGYVYDTHLRQSPAKKEDDKEKDDV